MNQEKIYLMLKNTNLIDRQEFVQYKYTSLCVNKKLNVGHTGLEPVNSKEKGFTDPCNCRYANDPLSREYWIRTSEGY